MSCVIVVPIYRPQLSPLEQVCLLRLRHFFRRDVFLVAPQNMCLDAYFYLWPDIQIKFFHPAYFASVKTYNKLMLDPRFYESFACEYDWMLIHQLDAFLFHDRLEPFCNLPYDYFGAPWLPLQLIHPKFKNGYLLKLFGTAVSVGNGGLSLRRLAPTITLLSDKVKCAEKWPVNEDAFFGYWGVHSDTFRSCTLEVAACFAFESNPRILFEMTNRKMPFGCHGLPKWDQEFYAYLINPLLIQMSELGNDLIERSIFELLAQT